jgi:hypothetical protein
MKAFFCNLVAATNIFVWFVGFTTIAERVAAHLGKVSALLLCLPLMVFGRWIVQRLTASTIDASDSR